MSEEELIETLKAFEKNRVEQLEEPARNLFYAIMKIADERDRLNNIINECAEDILKELEENHHLSYGVALGIRQKLLDYKELKGSDK